jgi:hypothetical protein
VKLIMSMRLSIRAWKGRAARAHRPQAGADAAERYLKALHRELRVLGVPSDIITSGTWPRLRLSSRYTGWDADAGFEGYLLAADVAGTGWSYWWPWIQRISPADDPAKAAEIIADELGVEVPAHDGQPHDKRSRTPTAPGSLHARCKAIFIH